MEATTSRETVDGRSLGGGLTDENLGEGSLNLTRGILASDSVPKDTFTVYHLYDRPFSLLPFVLFGSRLSIGPYTKVGVGYPGGISTRTLLWSPYRKT